MWWNREYEDEFSSFELRDQWAKKFPIKDRPANWAKAWSKWTNKTRDEVIKSTYK